MAIEETLKSTERTLKEAQQLMGKIQKQNEAWPGAGAFQEDITTAKTLLNEMQENFSDIFVEFTHAQSEYPDSGREMKVSRGFSETYSLMSRLHSAVKQVHLSFDSGLSQRDALIETEKYLKQLISHCVTVKDHFNEVGHEMQEG